MFFLSTKFGFPLFIFIISQSWKRESSDSTTVPKKKAKNDIPKEVEPSDVSNDGMAFPHFAHAKPQKSLACTTIDASTSQPKKKKSFVGAHESHQSKKKKSKESILVPSTT